MKYLIAGITLAVLSLGTVMAQETRSVWVGASLDAAPEPNPAGHACGLISSDGTTFSITCLSVRGGTGGETLADGTVKPVYDITQGIARLLARQGRVDIYAIGSGGVSTGTATVGLVEGGVAIGTRIVSHVDVVAVVKGAWSPSLEDNAAPRFAIGFRYQP